MSAPGKLRAAAWTGLMGLLLATLGCSDSNEPGGGGGGGDLVSQQIGPQGGTVRSADGHLTLTFPAGAVAETQVITIQPLESSEAGRAFTDIPVERAYELGPDGLVFQAPITAQVRGLPDEEAPDGSLKVSTGFLLTSGSGDAAEALENQRSEEIDGSRVLRGELTHFSRLVQTEEFATLSIRGVPNEVPEDEVFIVGVNLVTNTFPFHSVGYTNGSFPPIRLVEESESAVHPMQQVADNEFQGAFEHVCAEVTASVGYHGIVHYESDLLRWRQEISKGKMVKCSSPSKPILSVSKSGSGQGQVISDPAGITCGAGSDACSEPYASGTAVALTATPDAGSVFVDWSGACPGGSSVTTVVVDADKTCTAQFDLQVSTTIELYDRILLSYGLQAMGIDPSDENTLVTVGADMGGDLEIFDITNPRAPVEIGSVDDFCEGALDVFFADPPVGANSTFITTSTTDLKGCVNTVPPGPGTVWNYNFAPGGGAWIPGTSDYLLADFSGGRILRRSFAGGIVATIPLGAGQSCPFDVMVSGDLAFVIGEEGFAGTILDCAGATNLYIISLATNQLLRTVDVGATPRRVVVSPDRVRAYVTDFGEDEIYVVNIASGTVETTFVVGDGPIGMAFSASGSFLVVVNWNDGLLQMVNPLTGAVLASIDTEQVHPVEVLLTDDDRTAIVTGFGDEEHNQGGSLGLYQLNFNF